MAQSAVERQEAMENIYIEMVSEISLGRHELSDIDLRQIGEFTRENILTWVNKRERDWADYGDTLDFHVVCGGVETIPWADEKHRELWAKGFPQGYYKHVEEARKRQEERDREFEKRVSERAVKNITCYFCGAVYRSNKSLSCARCGGYAPYFD